MGRAFLKAMLVLIVLGGLAVFGSVVAGSVIRSSVVRACSIPVFRYALERWVPDLYELIVFHRGPLGPKDTAALRALAERSGVVVSDVDLHLPDEGGGCANVGVRTIDLAGQPDERAKRLWRSQGTPPLPWMTLQYPRSDITLWAGPLLSPGGGEPDERRRLLILESPARREIARRILSGDSVVWILLESGDRRKDDAAAGLLRDLLEKLEEVFELPEELPGMIDPDFGPVEAEGIGSGPELRLAFSMLRVARTDPAEEMLVKMLLGSEPDLKGFSEPMAFPVFGRGRVLYALVGKGINEQNIGETCAFLVGPCMCQVKGVCPGMDLLMSVDWESLIWGELVVEEVLPPLTGFPELVEMKEQVQESDVTESKEAAGELPPADAGPERGEAPSRPGIKGVPTAPRSRVGRNVLFLVAFGAAAVLAASLVVMMRRKGGRRP